MQKQREVVSLDPLLTRTEECQDRGAFTQLMICHDKKTVRQYLSSV